eukprot:GDKJ01027874.1.p1 GENE.GDKJ01027874.1~~GDKJ01027874.1.p1  ORF type:complete len:259 (-),score=27.57 GDKJ01027874.1:27-803(-)
MFKSDVVTRQPNLHHIFGEESEKSFSECEAASERCIRDCPIVWIDSDVESEGCPFQDPVCPQPLETIDIPLDLKHTPNPEKQTPQQYFRTKNLIAHNINRQKRLHGNKASSILTDNVKSMINSKARSAFAKNETIDDLMNDFVCEYDYYKVEIRDEPMHPTRAPVNMKHTLYKSSLPSTLEEDLKFNESIEDACIEARDNGRDASREFLGLLHTRLMDRFGLSRQVEPLPQRGRSLTSTVREGWSRFVSEPPKSLKFW